MESRIAMDGHTKVQLALESIQRLAAAQKNLQGPPNAMSTSSPNNLLASLSLGDTDSHKHRNIPNDSWGHWRILSPELTQIYELLHSGAEVVKVVSTKFTLVGAMDITQAGDLANELLQGCEAISTATLALYSHTSGCAMPTRTMARQATRAILATVTSLLEAVLHPPSSYNQNFTRVHPILAQKTGAVWDACDTILMKKIPKGNRASVRRQLLSFISESNDTLSEFNTLISMGPCIEEPDISETLPDEEPDLHSQYTIDEIPLAQASVDIILCSKRIVIETLQIMEHVAKDESLIRPPIYSWLQSLYDLVYMVGMGVTEVGVLLYPPAIDKPSLEKQLGVQGKCMFDVIDFVITGGNNESDLSWPPDRLEILKMMQSDVHAHLSKVNQLILCQNAPNKA